MTPVPAVRKGARSVGQKKFVRLHLHTLSTGAPENTRNGFPLLDEIGESARVVRMLLGSC